MSNYEIHIETRAEQHAAAASADVAIAEIGPWLGKHYPAIAGWLAAHGIDQTGPVYARYRILGDGSGRMAVDAGLVVADPVTPDDDTVEAVTLPGGTAAVTTHVGPYDTVGNAYRAIETWLTERGSRATEAPWEEYLDGPEVGTDQARTIVVCPCTTP